MLTTSLYVTTKLSSTDTSTRASACLSLEILETEIFRAFKIIKFTQKELGFFAMDFKHFEKEYIENQREISQSIRLNLDQMGGTIADKVQHFLELLKRLSDMGALANADEKRDLIKA